MIGEGVACADKSEPADSLSAMVSLGRIVISSLNNGVGSQLLIIGGKWRSAGFVVVDHVVL